MGQLSLPCGENLTADVFENNWPRLQVHHQHGLELSFSSLQLHLDMQKQKSGEHSNDKMPLLFHHQEKSATSPALPAIWMNSRVMISTISRTWTWRHEGKMTRGHQKESHVPESSTNMMQLSCNPTFKTCYCKLVSTCRGSALAWIHSRPLSS